MDDFDDIVERVIARFDPGQTDHGAPWITRIAARRPS
jgi:hypothetical protein